MVSDERPGRAGETARAVLYLTTPSVEKSTGRGFPPSVQPDGGIEGTEGRIDIRV